MKNSSQGQTLVEAVVVVGVVVLLVTGLVSATTVSLRSVQSGRIRSQAVSLSQEGIEIARGIRDESWDDFAGLVGLYCLGDNQQMMPAAGSCVPNITTPQGTLTRSVSFNWQNPKMVVTVTVSYVEGEGTRDVANTTYFTRWK